jgi:hypothetical protein
VSEPSPTSVLLNRIQQLKQIIDSQTLDPALHRFRITDYPELYKMFPPEVQKQLTECNEQLYRHWLVTLRPEVSLQGKTESLKSLHQSLDTLSDLLRNPSGPNP